MIKLNSRGFGVFEGLLIFVIIGVLGGVGFYVYKKNEKPKTLEEVVRQIKNELPNEYTDLAIEQSKWTAQQTSRNPKQVEGYEFKLNPQGSLTLTDSPKEPPVEEKIITRYLLFKKTISSVSSEGAEPVSSKVISMLENNDFSVSGNKEGVTELSRDKEKCFVSNEQLSCLSPTMLKAIAEEIQPFVKEYLKANPSIDEKDLTVGPLTIKSQDGQGVITASKNSGFDIAEVVFENKGQKKIALFYTNGDSWKYITQANDEFGFSCEDIKQNPDARKAFYNQICYQYQENKGQIRLDSGGRALQ